MSETQIKPSTWILTSFLIKIMLSLRKKLSHNSIVHFCRIPWNKLSQWRKISLWIKGYLKTRNSFSKNCTNCVVAICRSFLVSFNKKFHRFTCPSVSKPYNKWTETFSSTINPKYKYLKKYFGLIWIFSK